MNYAEAAYFEGNHCQHVAAYADAKWINERRKRAARDFRGTERRREGGTH